MICNHGQQLNIVELQLYKIHINIKLVTGFIILIDAWIFLFVHFFSFIISISIQRNIIFQYDF